MPLIREVNTSLIEQLQRHALFQSKLKTDVSSGDVFMAIRNQRIDFYHKGGKLFTYDGKFKTHIKFASVCRLKKEDEKNYVTQEDLAAPLKCDFIEDYNRIKENCAIFAGQEAEGVSRVYSQYSYAEVKSGARVLDIEVSFESDEEGRTQDRIDLLVINNGILRFYEAKHFSNGEIWAKPGSKPKVVDQIARYKTQIVKNEPNIIKQYQNYVEILNKSFGFNIESPNTVDHDVPLLVFGFDRDQLKGRFKKLFEDNIQDTISYYAIGDVSKIMVNNMWKACKS